MLHLYLFFLHNFTKKKFSIEIKLITSVDIKLSAWPSTIFSNPYWTPVEKILPILGLSLFHFPVM